MYRALAVSAALATLASCSGGSTYRGPALRFDGDDDRAVIGWVAADHPLSLAGSPFTVAAWFLQEPGGDPYQRIVDKSDDALGHNGWALAAHGPSGQIHLYSHDGDRGGDFVSRRGSYRTGEWHHVAGVCRGDRFEIWIDGRRDRSAFFEDGVHAFPAATGAELRIGSWNHATGREWNGLLGEVAVWRRDLEPEEIEALAAAAGRWDYREDRAAYRGSGDLVGYWRMAPDPADGARIPDLSESGADARRVGS